MSPKNRVTLATYLKWGKDNVLGKKIMEEDGTKFVVKIWCKVCAKYKSEILRELKGSAKNVKSSNVNIIFNSIFCKLKGFCVNLFPYRISSVMLTFNIIAVSVSLAIFYLVIHLLKLYFLFFNLPSFSFHLQ